MNLRPEFLSPLRTLTGIDSPSGDAEGVTKAGDVMEGIFRKLGWETDRPEVGSYGRACVFRNHPESETADLMLCAHLDTVHSRGSAARYPFRIDEGLAFGPGVADDRSGLAAIAAIASGLPTAVKDRLSLKVVLTPAEEIIRANTLSFSVKRPAAFPPPSFLSLDGRMAVLSGRGRGQAPSGWTSTGCRRTPETAPRMGGTRSTRWLPRYRS